jgi:hypothetical protein
MKTLMKNGKQSKSKWSVGVTATPRKEKYIDRTIQSIHNAGWEDVTIFAEPHSVIPDDFNGHVVHRKKQYGDWTNWATGLYELFLSEPDSDYILMSEDDCIFCKNLPVYLEYVIPLLPKFAYLSLYTGKELTVAILLERDKAAAFLGDKDVMDHRTKSIDTIHDNTSKDCVMGRWAESIGLPVYYHSPSLTEHIGVSSTLLWAKLHVEQWRDGKEYTEDDYPCSKDFVGEDFDASQWVGESFDVRNALDILQ